jgi:alanine racemase
MMTHFSSADELDNDCSSKQIKVFNEACKNIDAPKSMANSAGLLGIKASHHDWIRAGIMLYGSSPLIADSADSLGLLPVMTLSSELISIREVQQGESIGYGSTWIVDKTTKVGVVACGYGDGYPRQISENTPVLVNGQRSTILGRVSMDLIVVDLSNVDAEISSEVILWGKGLPIDEIAQSAGTIAYELMCGITHRVKKVHINS